MVSCCTDPQLNEKEKHKKLFQQSNKTLKIPNYNILEQRKTLQKIFIMNLFQKKVHRNILTENNTYNNLNF